MDVIFYRDMLISLRTMFFIPIVSFLFRSFHFILSAGAPVIILEPNQLSHAKPDPPKTLQLWLIEYGFFNQTKLSCF